MSGITLPMSLAPGAHVIMTVKFSPVQSGLIHRYVLLRSYATNSSVEYPLSGTGVAITPQTLAVTLTDTGNSSVTISGVSVTGIELQAPAAV